MWRFGRKPRLLLHVGTHKTGTTSIQKVLHDHRPYDRERGLFYPVPPRALIPSSHPHHDLAHCLAGDRPEERARAAIFRSYVRKAAHPLDRIVISSEPLYRHVLGMDWTSASWSDPSAYWPAREAYLKRLRRWLSPFDVSVLMFVREKRAFASSLAAEMARKQTLSVSADELMTVHSPQLFDYERQITLLSRYVGPVSVVDYDDSVARGGSVVAFYAALGLEPPPGSADVRVRVTNELDAPVAVDTQI